MRSRARVGYVVTAWLGVSVVLAAVAQSALSLTGSRVGAGTVDRIQPSGEASLPQAFGGVVPAGDLNGDGRGDVLDERDVTNGSRDVASITARDGRTGRALWRWQVAYPESGVLNATTGRVGVAGRRGVLIVSNSFEESTGATIVTVLALSGRTGRQVWHRRISSGPDGDIELVDATHELPGRDEDLVVVRAYTVDGHLIYQTAQTVSDPSTDDDADISVTVAGDFQPDGARDLQLSVLGPTRHYVSGWIDSRTGQLHKIPLLTNPVGHLSHQIGSDLIELEPRGRESRHLTITAAGIGQQVYWRRALHVPKFYLGQAVSLHASTPRCSDVLISDSDFPGRQLAAVYTGSGHLLWTLRFTGTTVFGGQLHRYPAPKSLCAGPAD